jgi:hypothetical protein
MPWIHRELCSSGQSPCDQPGSSPPSSSPAPSPSPAAAPTPPPPTQPHHPNPQRPLRRRTRRPPSPVPCWTRHAALDQGPVGPTGDRPLCRLDAAGIGPGPRRRRRAHLVPHPAGQRLDQDLHPQGIPEVRLLGAQGQPLTAPSVPGGPAGSLVVLRPGQAARFAFSEPNACDSFVTGSRLRVTLPQGRGSLTVPLGEETRSGPARASAFRPSRHPRHRRPPACPGSTGSRIPRWRPTAWLRPGSAVTARPPPSSPPAGPSMSGWSANDHRPSGRPSCPAGWWTWACICARTPLASPLS